MRIHRNILVLAAILFFSAWPAAAHAILLDATPSANQVVNGESVPVKLRFNSRIDAKRSKLALVSPDGSERVLGIDQSSPDSLSAKAESLKPGIYVLQWQVLAEDGHITRGQVSFRAQ